MSAFFTKFDLKSVRTLSFILFIISLLAYGNTLNMAICYMQMGQYDSAISVANRGLHLSPGNEAVKGTLDMAVKRQATAKTTDTTVYN